LDILTALVEHAGEVVGKDELMARAWPRISVDEGNLKFQICAWPKLGPSLWSLSTGLDKPAWMTSKGGVAMRIDANRMSRRRHQLHQAMSALAVRLTIIYRVLPYLIWPRTQGALVFLMPESLLRGCDEGPESRLAEMDWGGKNRRRVYRVRDEQHGPGAAPSQRRVVSGQRFNLQSITTHRSGGC
jgi:hypothetical protein